MTEQNKSFDPYAELPFVGYKSPITGEQEKYWSLMHFVEAEKLQGVDDEYRSYILGLKDKDDFILETAGVAAQFEPSSHWMEQRLNALYAGLFMQLVQNKEAYTPILMNGDLHYHSSTIREARDNLVTRLASSEPWRRVLFLGQQAHSDSVPDILNHIFVNRRPDELFVLDETGVADTVAQYSHDNYIPIRIIGGDEGMEAISASMKKLTHIFMLGDIDSASTLGRQAVQYASENGIKVHQVALDR